MLEINLLLLLQGQGHIWPSTFKCQGHSQGQTHWSHLTPGFQSICLLFVSWQSEHFWLRYSKFYIWPWQFKVKVMAEVKSDSHIWALSISHACVYASLIFYSSWKTTVSLSWGTKPLFTIWMSVKNVWNKKRHVLHIFVLVLNFTHGTGITTTICAFWYREVDQTNYQKSIGSATLRPCRAIYLSLWHGSTVRVVPMLPHGDKQPIEMAKYHITLMYIIWLFQCILSPLRYV